VHGNPHQHSLAPSSPKLILLAKSERDAIHVWQTVEHLECQRAGRRENDFAISIKTDEAPTPFTPVGIYADLTGRCVLYPQSFHTAKPLSSPPDRLDTAKVTPEMDGRGTLPRLTDQAKDSGVSASVVDDQYSDDCTFTNASPFVHWDVPAVLDRAGPTKPKWMRLCSSLTFGKRHSPATLPFRGSMCLQIPCVSALAPANMTSRAISTITMPQDVVASAVRALLSG
jgi:hypothetical protein